MTYQGNCYMYRPCEYDVIVMSLFSIWPIGFEIGFDPISYMTTEAIGRVTLVIRSSIPNPGPATLVLILTTQEETATGKAHSQTTGSGLGMRQTLSIR